MGARRLFWIYATCIGLSVSLSSICHGVAQEIHIYSCMGYRWGWYGSHSLSNPELDLILEAIETEKMERKLVVQRKRFDRVRQRFERYRAEGNKTVLEWQYSDIDVQPKRMVIVEQSNFCFGLCARSRRWMFNVAWQDDEPRDGERMITVINETNQPIFVESSQKANAVDIQKKLKGVGTNQARKIRLAPQDHCAIWQLQLRGEPLEELLTDLEVPAGSSLIRVSKQDGKLVARVVDGPLDEEYC